MSTITAEAPSWTPSAWLNKSMALMLKTPGLQRLVGRGTVLITFKGRSSGREITTPLSYVTDGDRIIVTGHRTRQWWRNLVASPEVRLRLAGKERKGVASVMENPDDALADYLRVLEAQPVVAKIAGVALDDEGKADRDKALEILAYTVVVSIEVEGSSPDGRVGGSPSGSKSLGDRR